MNGRRKTPGMGEAEAEAFELLMTEGVLAATHALIDTCKDPKATAQAKATAGRTIFEASGMLQRGKADVAKNLDEMSPEEAQALLVEIREQIRQAEADELSGVAVDGDVRDGQAGDLFE